MIHHYLTEDEINHLNELHKVYHCNQCNNLKDFKCTIFNFYPNKKRQSCETNFILVDRSFNSYATAFKNKKNNMVKL